MEAGNKVQEYIDKLGLTRHPEGGWYRETYRSAYMTELGPAGERHISTAIYFLLQAPDFSAFHRIESDEMWHLYDASPGTGLRIHMLDESAPDGNSALSVTELGRSGLLSGHFQTWVPARVWFAAEVFALSPEKGPPAPWILAGCTVSPGFDFADFELATASELETIFPANTDTIKRFCIK